MIPRDVLARIAASDPGGDRRKAKIHDVGSAVTYRRAAKAKKAKVKKRKQVPAQAIADFLCRFEGATMGELVKRFKIKAHPMRAKIYFVRHTLGYQVVIQNGRYFGTVPGA